MVFKDFEDLSFEEISLLEKEENFLEIVYEHINIEEGLVSIASKYSKESEVLFFVENTFEDLYKREKNLLSVIIGNDKYNNIAEYYLRNDIKKFYQILTNAINTFTFDENDEDDNMFLSKIKHFTI